MRQTPSSRQDRRMRRIVVALDELGAPRGRLEQTGVPERAFDGWLQLIAALEDCLQAMRDRDTPCNPVLEADS
jgi:hypothetical protein